MVKLSKTRLWDVFSAFAYVLALVVTMLVVVGVAIALMQVPELLGLA
ncbi:MAG: hypothetical protein QXF45_02330 [Candidatus Caldarchaeum sp.]